MYQYLKYRCNLYRLQKEKRKIYETLNPKVDEARRSGDRDEEGALIAQIFAEADLVDDEIAALQLKRISRLAEKYLVPLPPLGDETAWNKSELYPNRIHLKPEAIIDIQDKIHQVRKRSQELWLPWIAAVTGLIAALTGLIAVLASG